MKKYKVVLFDLDGTVTDPGAGITNSVAYALKKYSIEIADKTSLYKFIGPPLAESFEKFYGFTKEEAKRAVDFYREYYSETGIFENVLYDGIEGLIKKLNENGYIIMLATSKPEFFANQILEHFGIAQYFNFVAGSNMDGTRTDKAEVIAYALDAKGITDKSTVIMVGDRKFDIIGARKQGINSIGVLFGYGEREELESENATYIAANIEELENILL